MNGTMPDGGELNLPPLPNYPPKTVHSQLPPEEWRNCLQLWIANVELRLALSDDQFLKSAPQQTSIPFVLSYLRQHQISSKTSSEPGELSLGKLCLSLLRRLLNAQAIQLQATTYFDLISSGGGAFGHNLAWRKFLRTIWTSRSIQIRKALESAKTDLATSTQTQERIRCLHKISILTKSLPETATVTVASADYLDTLTDIFKTSGPDLARAVTENVFYSFTALLHNKYITILTDNIYHMKSEADRLQKVNSETPTLLSSLLCTTSFLKHLSSNSEVATRKQTLVDQLSTYRQNTIHLHPTPAVLRRKKGKERTINDEGMHMHKAAQVSQVHELFPNLSTGYILKVLDHFSDNVESVIAALLEPDSLPEQLRDQSTADTAPQANRGLIDLAPNSTPPLLPQRTGVFDNDNFDRLQIPSKQLRRGKKAMDEPLASDDHTRSKAAIMSALAAFDSDDDERDDSYDVADVGGAVDNTVDTDERRKPDTDANESALFQAWKSNPEIFARDSKTRMSNIRQQLKRDTAMGDEQIEGWAIMLSRDKKMQDRLQDKYSATRAFGGQQVALQSTRWQASMSTENSESESGPERSNDTRRMGQEGIRGHRNFGRGRGRGGGSASGDPNDAATQAARRRKEQGRGRGGGNQRRDARAKKVGRGMGPLPPS